MQHIEKEVGRDWLYLDHGTILVSGLAVIFHNFKNRKCKEFLPKITYKQLDFSIPDFFQTDGSIFATTPTPCPSH